MVVCGVDTVIIAEVYISITILNVFVFFASIASIAVTEKPHNNDLFLKHDQFCLIPKWFETPPHNQRCVFRTLTNI